MQAALGTETFAETQAPASISLSGFSGPEPIGRWTDGPRAAISLALAREPHQHVLLKFDLAPFVSGKALPEQIVDVTVNSTPLTRWTLFDTLVRRRVILVKHDLIPPSNEFTVEFEIPTCSRPSALNLNNDARLLGVNLRRVGWELLADIPPDESLVWQYGRPVGGEARKSFDQKIESGFWSRFITGQKVLDVGFRGYQGARVVPILEGAIGVDLDYPGYNGRILPFAEGSQDAVYSSHCLEHIADYVKAIQEWHRVVKVGGHIITVVPNALLYERKLRPPSRHNDTHMRFYTAASLLGEFEEALRPNSYRVRHLVENDQGYRYDDDPEAHPRGCYEIELVVQKIAGPAWSLSD